MAPRNRPRAPSRAVEVDDDWLAGVAAAASQSSGGAPPELLGEYLRLLTDAAVTGRPATARELEAVGVLGRRAAEQGVSAGRVVDLYLSAALQVWRRLPEVSRTQDSDEVRQAADAVLHVVDDAVATLAEAYTSARRLMVRREEALRRELIDDLMRGDADVGGLVERAEPFGLDLARSHRVVLAAPSQRLPDVEAVTSALERGLLDRLGDVLVSIKDGRFLVLSPDARSPARARGPRISSPDLGSLVHRELNRLRHGRPWRVAVGRAYPGPYGVARSYEEAREALALVDRLRSDSPVVHAEDLLVYRVLVRDQPAMADLVDATLGPLKEARGGAVPLLDTLDAYFSSGAVATEAARRLHLSVRAVTYRLERVRTLTGFDPADPEHRFTLHAAVLGAKLLGWPAA